MRLSFHGAARGVTGSCHMIECAPRRLLVDCGMFQGGRDLDEENAADFGFDPGSIDAVLLTHAHLDHCGRLPLLVKRGFRGEVSAPPRPVIWHGWCCSTRRICRKKNIGDASANTAAAEVRPKRCRSIHCSMR